MQTGMTRFLGTSAALLCSFAAAGQELRSLVPWLSPQADPTNSTFGIRLDCKGDWLAIAADHEVPYVYGEGSVHLYFRADEGWEYRQTITAPESVHANHFGLPVVLGEQRLIIGSPGDNDLGGWAGAAYVYTLEKNEWKLEQKILSPTNVSTEFALFGHAASFGVDEQEILIGAFNESTESLHCGAAYAYTLQDGVWEFTQRFHAPGSPSGTSFGTSIAVNGQSMAIGMYGYRFPGASWPQGGVAIYTRVGDMWSNIGHLYPENPQAYQGFGQWVDFNDGTMVVCSSSEDTVDGAEGVLHIYDMVDSVPVLNTTIEPPIIGAEAFSFPSILSDDGKKIFVGAYRTDIDGLDDGAAWILQKIDGVWGSPVRLMPSQPAAEARFGVSAVFDGEEIFVGAHRHPMSGSNAGAVFRFLLTDCNENDVLDPWELHAGTAPDGNGDTILDECQDQPCDMNFDGKVNGGDLAYLIGLWGTDGSSGADFDASGLVDAGDLGFVLASWNP